MTNVPFFLHEMLLEQFGEINTNKIIEGYSKNRYTTLRVNTLKTTIEKIKGVLSEKNIEFKEVSWYKDALILPNVQEKEIRNLSIYNNGEIYLQSLSSMLPVIILNPQKKENILDMTAAPGGKTTQISAMTEGEALITACEKNTIRLERLKFNIEKQGAKRVNIMLQDARKLDNYFSFDKILLDAPCSGSGTINLSDKNFEKNFNKELVIRSVMIQFELLKKALKILKPGHEMVYSTCSILRNENEENLRKLIETNNVEIIPIDEKMLEGVPLLPTKIKGTICVCPNELYEGFFVAKIRKK